MKPRTGWTCKHGLEPAPNGIDELFMEARELSAILTRSRTTITENLARDRGQ